MRAKLTQAQVRRRLRDYFNDKRLYGETQEKCRGWKNRWKAEHEENARLKASPRKVKEIDNCPQHTIGFCMFSA